MIPTISAFRWVPPFAQGYARDLRLRWALEEVDAAYEVVLVDSQMLASTQYRAWQPFGQVPAYRDDEVELFESGAIVLHIARTSDKLAPGDSAAFARVTAWVIAALNSVEPPVKNFANLDGFPASATWVQGYRPVAEAELRGKLEALEARLTGRDYLEDSFCAGDIVMATVLRDLAESGILGGYPALAAYLQRCEARPAFARALAAQLDDYRKNAPA